MVKKHFKYLIIPIILLCLLFTLLFYLKRNKVQVTLYVEEINQPFEMQLFWRATNEVYLEKKSKKNSVKIDKYRYQFEFEANLSEMEWLRIDFGYEEGIEAKISEIHIGQIGYQDIILPARHRFREIKYNNSLKVLNNEFDFQRVITTGKDGYLEIPIRIGNRKTGLEILISSLFIIILFYLGIYTLFHNYNEPKAGRDE